MVGIIQITADTSEAEQQLNDFYNKMDSKNKDAVDKTNKSLNSTRLAISETLHAINVGLRLYSVLGEGVKQTTEFQIGQIALSQLEAQWSVAMLKIKAQAAWVENPALALYYGGLAASMEILALNSLTNKTAAMQMEKEMNSINLYMQAYR